LAVLHLPIAGRWMSGLRLPGAVHPVLLLLVLLLLALLLLAAHRCLRGGPVGSQPKTVRACDYAPPPPAG
jgi:hypothetical protein